MRSVRGMIATFDRGRSGFALVVGVVVAMFVCIRGLVVCNVVGDFRVSLRTRLHGHDFFALCASRCFATGSIHFLACGWLSI